MWITRLAAIWLLFVLAFGWGIATITRQVWPYPLYAKVAEFAEGGLGERSSLWGKVQNDLGLAPARWTHPFDHASIPSDLQPLEVAGLKDRRDPVLMHLSPDAPRGYRFLVGAFDFTDTFWGALLIGPEGELVRQWTLSTDDLPTSTAPSERKNLYGVTMTPAGDIVFQMQEKGGGIVSVDYCGARNWATEGIFHHTISPDGRGGFWTYEGAQDDFDHVIARYDLETGALLDRIDMGEVRRQNRHVHIFDLQKEPDVPDRVHGNDIEELTAERAAAFPGFEAGDLVLSYRVPNLVFVIDPDTLDIKWWRIGPWDRQHDPDWGADGKITVYSNNERGVGGYSTIVAIDPATYETEVRLDGAAYNFMSLFNGTHQVTPTGGLLVTSSHQGRVFETDADGEIVFDFLNSYDVAGGGVLHMGDAIFLPMDFFNEGLPECS